MSRRKYIRIISFLSFLSVFLCVSTAVFGFRAYKYKLYATVSNERAISELCENLDNISTVLQKGVYSNSKAMLSDISSKIERSAACAKVSLGQLTDKSVDTEEIYKFLSQVGDFTSSILKNLNDKNEISSTQRDSIEKLYSYSSSLASSIGEIRDGYYDSTVTFEKDYSNLSLNKKDEAELFSDSVNDIEQSLADYPTLVYDGPFADSVLKREALFVKGKDEITAAQAKEKAAKLLGADSTSLRQESDEDSALSLYCFSMGEKSIAITKQGGYLCYMTNSDFSLESTISEKEAVKRAKAYLDSIGYENMSETYYSDWDGVCTVNFAYYQDGVTYYSDLIKVSVALDSGKVVAIDARGFLTNHCQRSIPKEILSKEQCQKKLCENLSVVSCKKALIPLSSGKESFCYEFHCKDKNSNEVLVYLNAQTAQEENILLLLYADGGVMTK